MMAETTDSFADVLWVHPGIARKIVWRAGSESVLEMPERGA
jgi:hypothetical protein